MRSSLFAQPSTGTTAREANAARDANRLNLMRHDEQTVQRENDEIMDALGNDVAELKRAAAGMRDEVKEHNILLDLLSGRFTQAASGVRAQTSRLDNVMKQYGFKHTAAIGVGLCLAVILLYYIVTALTAKKPAEAA